MNADLTYEQHIGIKRLIVRKRILRLALTVFPWSLLPLAAVLAIISILGLVPFHYAFVVGIAVMAVLVAFIIAMKAKNVAIDVTERLGKYSFNDWFTVLSVRRIHGRSWPIEVVLRDVLGGEHKVYYSGSSGKVDVDDLENLWSHLAYLTRPRWEPALAEMKKHDFPTDKPEGVSDLPTQGSVRHT